MGISVTHSTLMNVKAFAETRLPAAGKVLHINLPDVGQDAIKNGGHAFRAAKEVTKLIGQRRQVLGLGGRIHLFWSAPKRLRLYARAALPIIGIDHALRI